MVVYQTKGFSFNACRPVPSFPWQGERKISGRKRLKQNHGAYKMVPEVSGKTIEKQIYDVQQ